MSRRLPGTPALVLAVVLAVTVAFVGGFGLVGSDCLWLVALGDRVRETGGVPAGVPYASAPTAGWVNVPVLAELGASLVHAAWGTPGLLGAHVAIVGAALVVVAAGCRRAGAGDGATAGALALLALGTLSALAVVRLQTLSLLPYAVLVLLLRAEHRRPGRRVWLLVPLTALWGNLHGGVLAGVAVSGCYLLLSRARGRPLESALVLVAQAGAVALTPALGGTPAYYLGVLGNEAARQSVGLWAPLDLGAPLDVLTVVAGLALAGGALRHRRPLWEYAAGLGLLVATVGTARHGVWLLLLLAAPAAAGMTRGPRPALVLRAPARPCRTPTAGAVARLGGVVAVLGPLTAAAVLAPLLRGSGALPFPPALVDRVVAVSDGGVVLAPSPLAESLAARGVRVWVSNPLDAFGAGDQRAYLRFQATGVAGPAAAHADVVVLPPGPSREAGRWVVRDLRRHPARSGPGGPRGRARGHAAASRASPENV